MPRKVKAEARESGLYQNGQRWWVRSVSSPLTGSARPLSTGTKDLARANRVKRLLDELAENRTQWEWLDRAVTGEVTLDQLATHHAAGSLHTLRSQLATQAAVAEDGDLAPWVTRWDAEHLTAMVASGQIQEDRRALLVRYVRAFIPAGVAFPRSKFTEEWVKATLFALEHPTRHTPLEPPTRRKYLEALQLFYRWAKKSGRAGITTNPFVDDDGDAPEWAPQQNSPRSTFWDYPTIQLVLSKMEGDRRAFMALVLGSGMELGAALAMKGIDVGPSDDDRTVVAPGSKNVHREQRTVFVAEWAWQIFAPHARTRLPYSPLWQTVNPVNRGRDIRDAFYWAQVEAGVIAEPPKNATGKYLWKQVKPHTIHDARHTYCVVRMLGLDGEPRQDAKFCSMQLGHADETMVLKIYSKANIRERLKLIELREARQQGAAAAAGGGK